MSENGTKTENLRVCRKCLRITENREEFFQRLKTYIASLNEEDRAGQDVYETRLARCAVCRHLTDDGMCRLCGCYVELRAALRVRRCPDTQRRW